MARPLTFVLNGRRVEFSAEPGESLLDTLRDRAHLTGTKRGCDEGECGACTVLVDGRLALACLTLAHTVQDAAVTTIEGLGTGQSPHPLQKVFAQEWAIQCGFCIPGMVLAAKHLLDRNPRPTEAEVRAGLAGNLCRCTGYTRIVRAVLDAATAR
jgi:carbon-monoxide dehydrogenase small subunit